MEIVANVSFFTFRPDKVSPGELLLLALQIDRVSSCTEFHIDVSFVCILGINGRGTELAKRGVLKGNVIPIIVSVRNKQVLRFCSCLHYSPIDAS